jgi:Tfp pilus assembly protein PilZ
MEPDSAGQQGMRASERKILPLGISAILTDSSGFRAFVVIRDISAGGVGVTRQGKYQIPNDSDVQLEVSDHDAAQRLLLPANVRWLRVGRFTTMIGLSLYDRGAELEDFMNNIRNDR